MVRPGEGLATISIWPDTLALIGQADDPLRLGLRVASSLAGTHEQGLFLAQVLNRFGRRCDASGTREIARLAEDLSCFAPEQARSLLAALEDGSGPAAAWMRALLLANAGRYAEAAAALEAIPDAVWGEERALRLLERARALRQAGAAAEAWRALRDAARASASYRMLCAVDRLLGKWKAEGDVPGQRQCKVALVGSTASDFWLPALRAACLAGGIEADIHLGAFGQYQQEILDPQSGLAAFGPHVVIIASDWRTLALPDEVDDAMAVVEAKVAELRRLWRQARDRLGAFVIQHDFEVPPTEPYGRLSASLPGGRARLLRRINLGLWEAAQEEAGVAILDLEQAASTYGKARWSDPALWHTARQYPAPEALPALARRQVALLRAVLGLSAKGLVLDLDGTLWGGAIGEEGLAGITLGGSGPGEAFVAFQRYLQSLARRGIILAVCSKNNDDDARLPFRAHPEMVLSLDDIALFVANWRPKDENVRLIAETLNIGLDSLVVVDDSSLERAWLRRQLPELEVPELPEDPALYPQALDQGMYFEALSLTEEDRRRGEDYRGNVERKALEAASASLDEFLASLQMRVQLEPFDEANLPRIAQLINKTNQFNLTTRRLSESEVRSLIGCPGCYTQALRLRDRFGDNGLTGVLIALAEGDCLRISDWLLSCRVLGRRLEQVMLAALMCYARAQGLRHVLGEYVPTARNGQVSDLFDRLGFERLEEGAQGERRYAWDLSRGVLEGASYCQVDDRTQVRSGDFSRSFRLGNG